MPETHNLPRERFFHFFTYPRLSTLYRNRKWREQHGLTKPRIPFIDHGTTHEIETPFRVGITVLFRLPFTRLAFAYGHWTGRFLNEDEALMAAMEAADIGYFDTENNTAAMFGGGVDEEAMAAYLAEEGGPRVLTLGEETRPDVGHP